MNKILLNDDISIPQLGFGTWQIPHELTQEAIESALNIGYRHIDTAEGYGNLEAVGKAIKSSSISREKIFITTKVWVEDFVSEERILEAGKRFLDLLGTEYQDLILIHWPLRKDFDVSFVYEALMELKELGITKSIGVSNFSIKHIKDLMNAGFTPSLNQFELHPSLFPKKLVHYCEAKDIRVSGYMPFAWREDFKIPLIKELSYKYQVTPAHLCIAWQINKGWIVLPRSASRVHMKENYDAQFIKLEKDDMDRIDHLNLNKRYLDREFLEKNVPDIELDWRFDLED